ncbi:cation/H(+) antiporter 15-like [Rutidosis leptorrhynchoides]|uniref:cation/H(+) antiporter 15-like n=1 Tax=Rutidosis leptorrhynchoides TaxID=125765 RepID=UPI003A99E691
MPRLEKRNKLMPSWKSWSFVQIEMSFGARKNPDGSTTIGRYTTYNADNRTIMTCYVPENINFFVEGHSPWSIRPMTDYFPLLVLRFCLGILLTRLMNIVLKPLKAPPFVANVIGGIILGPGGVLFWNRSVITAMFPFEGNQVMELVSNLALTYYMFLVGLEMDLAPIWNVGSKAICISLAGILPPIAAGIASMRIVRQDNDNELNMYGSIYWAIALTVTSFPDVARLLSDLKLMQTDVGKTALISALLNDIASWTLLVVAVTVQSANLSASHQSNWEFYLKVVPTLVFIPFCWFVLRPLVSWLIKHSVDLSDSSSSSVEDKYTNLHVYSVITAVSLFGFITDSFGSHSMAGAFMFGLIIPPGELGTLVMEKIEDFVNGILLPIFFLTNGTRFNAVTMVGFISKKGNLTRFLSVIALSFSVKIISTCMVSLFLGFEILEGFTLGALMNTKGVLALIVVNAGRNLKGFDQMQFTTIVTEYILMTIVVVPLVNLAYKPAKRFLIHKRRTLLKCPADSELRIITCVHSMNNATAITSFLQALNPTRRYPIKVFPIRLVELTGRVTAMLIVHDTLKTEKSDNHEIINTFLDMEEENVGAFILRPLTVVSAYSTMHQDIVNIGEDERASLIIIPFHKQAMADGRMDEGNPSIREVNLNLLESAPCSVGLLVDRGHGFATQHSHHHVKKDFNIAMIFIGGPDCREALACAWRMAKTPGVSLTVVRYVSGNEVDPNNDVHRDHQEQLDDAYINEFRFKTMSDDCILYLEKQVNSGEETVQALNEGYNDIDLYVVGRGKDGSSPLTLGLAEWCECKELGIVADTLMQSGISSSILVVQHYRSKETTGPDARQAFVNHRKKDDYSFRY